MKTTIVKDLMSKYNLTKKDLFSFCICAVNFLEYYEEECMGDVMRGCPERYFNANSNNTKAAAGALNGEKKEMGWSDEEQFADYMLDIQRIINEATQEGDTMNHFLDEYQRFQKVYKREIMVPIMLGCPVEDYDDNMFFDDKYIRSIANADNLMLFKADEEEREAEIQKYREERAAAIAKKVESNKEDEDFSVLLASIVEVTSLKDVFEEYNKTYYPGRDYKVIPLHKPQLMIIQTGGKSIKDVKDRILYTVKNRVIIAGHDTEEKLIPIEKAFDPVPQIIKDNKVTHMVTYF
jgi:hypothetical protein